MRAFVVDTNVLIVANGRQNVSDQCLISCVSALEEVRAGIVVIDDQQLIFTLYRRNLNDSGQPGIGDAFLKWLLQNQANSLHREQVPLTPSGLDNFPEFPDDPALAKFDKSDRKFVAVALTSRHNRDVMNAVDSDWWDVRETLSRHGLRIRFLCPEEKPS